MAKVRLDIEGNFGNVLPDLSRMNNQLGDVGDSATEMRTKVGQAFTKNKNIVDEFGGVLIQVENQFTKSMKGMGDATEKSANRGKTAVVGFKKEIRAAELEAAGLYRQAQKGLIPEAEAIKAQKRVSALKEQFSDFRQSIDAFNPERKFTAFSQVLQGTAGGASAVVGLLGAMNAESEETAKWLTRIQGVLAFSQGINQVLGLGDAFTNLKNVLGITSGQMQKTTEESTSLTSAVVHTGEGIYYTAHGAEVLDKKTGQLTKALKGKTIATEAETAATAEQNTVQIVNTEGKVISTVATNNLAKSEAGAAVQATVLSRAMALLTGPVGIAAIAVGAIYGAFKLWFSSGVDVDKMTKELEVSQERFEKQINDTKSAFERQNEVLQANIDLLVAQNKLKVAIAGGAESTKGKKVAEETGKEELEAQRLQTEKVIKQNEDLIRKQEAQIKKVQDKLGPVSEALSTILGKQLLLKTTDPLFESVFGPSDTDIKGLTEFVKKNSETKDKLAQSNKDLATKNDVLRKGQEQRETEFDAGAIERENEKNKALLAKRLELAHKLIEIQRQMAKQIDDLEQGAQFGNPRASAQQKIDDEKSLAILKLNETKKALEAQGQLEEDTRAKLEKRKAGFFELTNEQIEALQQVRDNIEFRHQEATTELQRQAELNRLASTKESVEKELDTFRTGYEERRKLLVSQGFTEEGIQKDFNVQLEKATLEANDKRLQMNADIQKSLIDQEDILGVSAEQGEKIRSARKLEVDLQYAKDKLQLLLDTNKIAGGIDEKQFQAAKAQIVELGRQLKSLRNDIASGSKPISWAKIFGISPEDTDKFNTAVADMLDKAGELKDAFFAQQQESLDAELAANQERVDSTNDRLSELEHQLDRELDLNKEGLANNLDAVKAQIAAIKAERDRELAQQKKIQDEKRRLAREQAIIDGISQTSSLITAVANVFASESTKGLYGVIIAIGAVAALFASFLSIKSKIESANKLEAGGWIDGPSHSDGGVAYQAVQPGKSPLELEGGEFAVRKKQARKHASFLEKLNKGRYDEVSLPELMPFLGDMKIGYSFDDVNQVVERRSEVSRMEIHYGGGSRENVGEKVEAMHGTLKDYVDHRMNEEHTHELQDGTRIITRRGGAHVDIIKK